MNKIHTYTLPHIEQVWIFVHHVDVVDLVDVVIHIVDTLTPPPDDSKVSQYTHFN